MPIDEDLPTPKLDLVPDIPLDRLGIEELHAYIAALQGAIARAQAEVARKDAMRNAADAFFRIS